MDLVQTKYDNMKEFIKSLEIMNASIIIFLQTDLDTFIELFTQKVIKEKMTNKKLLDMLSDKLDMDLKKLGKEKVERLVRYIDFFRNTVKILTQ